MRLLLLLAGALALALGSSGCGSSASALDPLAQAAQITSRAGGAHVALSVQVTATGLPVPFVMSGEGFFNYHSQEGMLSLDAAGAGGGGSVGLPAGPVRIEEIFKSSTIYVSSPLLAGKLPGGARWLRLDVARFAQAAGLDMQQLAGGQANPAQFLQYLRAIAGTPVRVGSELVRGASTTRYHASVDLAKLAGVLSGGSGGELHAALAKLAAQLGSSEMPVDVWVDSHGLVRRIGLALSLATGTGRARVGLTIELFGFGPTPSLTPPPQREVFDATQAALGASATSTG
jgi:hypothetical protein